MSTLVYHCLQCNQYDNVISCFEDLIANGWDYSLLVSFLYHGDNVKESEYFLLWRLVVVTDEGKQPETVIKTILSPFITGICL